MTTSSRRPPGRPTGRTHVVDRERVLDAAEVVISREGHGASIEAIATEAGITKPIVYARVGSRAELSDALAQRLGDRLNAGAQEAIGENGPSERSVLAAVFCALLETISAHRELFLFITRGTTKDAPERTLYLTEQSAAPLVGLLEQLRRTQGRDPAVAVPWAYGIIGMLNLVALWWMEQSDRSAEVLAEQLAELVWPGLAGR